MNYSDLVNKLVIQVNDFWNFLNSNFRNFTNWKINKFSEFFKFGKLKIP